MNMYHYSSAVSTSRQVIQMDLTTTAPPSSALIFQTDKCGKEADKLNNVPQRSSSSSFGECTTHEVNILVTTVSEIIPAGKVLIQHASVKSGWCMHQVL